MSYDGFILFMEPDETTQIRGQTVFFIVVFLKQLMALIHALRSKSECIPTPAAPYNLFVGFQFTFTTRYVLIQYRLINGRRNLFLSL